MDNNEKFLSLYKELEAVIDGIYHPRASDSPVWYYENHLKRSDNMNKKLRSEKYATIRSLRNMLSHEDMNAHAPFMVSDETIAFVKNEIEYLENQETAMDVCVPFQKLVYATKKSYVFYVAEAMLSKGISNVPILEGRKVIGMFNGKAFIHMMKMKNKVLVTDQTKISDIHQFLYLDMHDGIRYEFVSKTTKLDVLQEIFKRNNKGKTELVIVTEDGGKYSDVLGVISPHDILERR